MPTHYGRAVLLAVHLITSEFPVWLLDTIMAALRFGMPCDTGTNGDIVTNEQAVCHDLETEILRLCDQGRDAKLNLRSKDQDPPAAPW